MKADHISLADALAFDLFTDEQKRIAYAGVALHESIEAKLDDAHRAGFDEGRAVSKAVAEEERGKWADEIDALTNALALTIPLLPPMHTATDELRVLRRKLTDLVDALRAGGNG